MMRQRNRESNNSTIQWQGMGKIGCTLYLDRLAVSYRYGAENYKDTFYFSGVSNNYGGSDRIYFTCPECSRRSRFLYFVPSCFKCRLCAKLNYRSQQVTKGDWMPAAAKVARYIQDKFKDDSDIPHQHLATYAPPRPKGVHRVTYDRLMAVLTKLQGEYVALYNRHIQRPQEAIESSMEEAAAFIGSIDKLLTRKR